MEQVNDKTLKYYKAILNNIPDAAWLKDIKSRYILINKAFEDISGMSSEKIYGKTDFDIWPKELAEKYLLDDRSVINKAEETVIEECIKDRSGACKWVETIKTPLKNENREIIGTVGISRDVTQRKESESKLRKFEKDLRSLTLEMTQSQEKERRRISIALHDNVCQNLAYCRIKIGELEGQEQSVKSSLILKDINDIIARTIQYTRSLTFDLSPPVLYELGLEPAIEWLGEHIIKKRGMDFSFVHEEEPIEMDQELKVLLFQITREILTNTLKHSGAKKVSVIVRKTGQSIMISVVDDGVGFNVPELIKNRPDSYGFFSIRQRLSHIGGYFNIKSHPGNGTRANIVVPVQ